MRPFPVYGTGGKVYRDIKIFIIVLPTGCMTYTFSFHLSFSFYLPLSLSFFISLSVSLFFSSLYISLSSCIYVSASLSVCSSLSLTFSLFVSLSLSLFLSFLFFISLSLSLFVFKIKKNQNISVYSLHDIYLVVFFFFSLKSSRNGLSSSDSSPLSFVSIAANAAFFRDIKE